VVAKKSGLSEVEISSVVDVLLTNIQIVPADDVLSKWKEAEEVMAQVDKDDIPFVAALMAVDCDGIWTDDKHFRRQGKVEVWTTKDVLGLASRV
jgi:predicted nucleic acid-binding protein